MHRRTPAVESVAAKGMDTPVAVPTTTLADNHPLRAKLPLPSNPLLAISLLAHCGMSKTVKNDQQKENIQYGNSIDFESNGHSCWRLQKLHDQGATVVYMPHVSRPRRTFCTAVILMQLPLFLSKYSNLLLPTPAERCSTF